MGYTTDFSGEFTLDKPLTPQQLTYLQAFNHTRRMKRNAAETAKRPDPAREAAGLPVGDEGAYFVGEGGPYGQTHSPDVLDYNQAPKGQPGLWCQWMPNDDGTAIVWDEGEKFYDYTEWLEYLIEHFLKPWGYVLNGEVTWHGEDDSDRGTIYVKDNQIEAVDDVIGNPGPSWARNNEVRHA